jgi:hypothetical protein
MSERHPSTEDSRQPTRYEIRIQGHLDHGWADWFGDVTVTLEDDGNTLLTGEVVDQAALYAMLKKVRDLGVPLVSVNRIKPDQKDTPEVKL